MSIVHIDRLDGMQLLVTSDLQLLDLPSLEINVVVYHCRQSCETDLCYLIV